MAAPTVVYIESTQANATTAIPASTITSPAVGDLAVVVREGLQTSGTLAKPTYTAGGDAGYSSSIIQSAITAAGNGRIVAWWKVLVSGDFSGPNFKQLTVGTATFTAARTQLFIFRHARGWDATLFADKSTNANQANSTANTLTDFTREGVVVATYAATAGVEPTVAWDGGTARAPWCNNSTTVSTAWGPWHAQRADASCGLTNGSPNVTDAAVLSTDTGRQLSSPHLSVTTALSVGSGTFVAGTNASSTTTETVTFQIGHDGTNQAVTVTDWQEYSASDTASSYAWNLQNNNNTHVFLALQFRVAPPATVNGTAVMSGGGTFAASGLPTVGGTATIAGGGTFAASGLKTVLGTAVLSGGGTFAAAQQGVTTVQGTAVLSGGGTFAASGAKVLTGASANVAGGGTFHATGVRTTFATLARLSGGGTFGAHGITGTIASATGGTWAEGSASSGGPFTWTGVAVLSGGGTFAASGTKLAPNSGLAQFRGGGTFTASGTRTTSGVAVLSGGGTFTAEGDGLSSARVRMTFRPRQRMVVRQ